MGGSHHQQFFKGIIPMTSIGGPAQVVAVTNLRPMGRTAYGVKAMTQASADRTVEGGPASPIYIVSQAELDAGTFILEGTNQNSPMCSVQDGRSVEGGPALPVFIFEGSFGSLSGNALQLQTGDMLLTEAGNAVQLE